MGSMYKVVSAKAGSARAKWGQLAQESGIVSRLATLPCKLALASLLLMAFVGLWFNVAPKDGSAERLGWSRSYKAGYTDENGRFAGGSEIMHIKAHRGRLFAFNGYWKDSHYPNQSAQVLRLDTPGGRWVVDLDTGADDRPSHMKGNILASVHLRTDSRGLPTDKNLLMAASAADSSARGGRAISVFVRDDTDGSWARTVLLPGPQGGRRVPRSIRVYRDTVTGVDRVFLLCGDSGITSGAFDATLGRLEWAPQPEYPTDGRVFQVRALGLASANGKLYFSDGGELFERVDGPEPSWTLALKLPGHVNTEVGGIRGLSKVRNPTGPGDSLVFVWAADGHSAGEIRRLDGPNLTMHTETSLKVLSGRCAPKAGTWSFSLGGYNQFFPIRNPESGAVVHVIGFETRLDVVPDPQLAWNGFYAGACYAARDEGQQEYSVHEVNGSFEPGKPVLEAPRAFELSPFAEEPNVLYMGGFDANFFSATSRAWVYKADVWTVLGLTNTSALASAKANERPPTRRLREPSLPPPRRLLFA